MTFSLREMRLVFLKWFLFCFDSFLRAQAAYFHTICCGQFIIIAFCFVTGSHDGVVKVWDIRDGSLLLTVPEAGQEIGKVRCCCDDEIIVASSKTGITVISFETGEILHR